MKYQIFSSDVQEYPLFILEIGSGAFINVAFHKAEKYYIIIDFHEVDMMIYLPEK